MNNKLTELELQVVNLQSSVDLTRKDKDLI